MPKKKAADKIPSITLTKEEAMMLDAGIEAKDFKKGEWKDVSELSSKLWKHKKKKELEGREVEGYFSTITLHLERSELGVAKNVTNWLGEQGVKGRFVKSIMLLDDKLEAALKDYGN